MQVSYKIYLSKLLHFAGMKTSLPSWLLRTWIRRSLQTVPRLQVRLLKTAFSLPWPQTPPISLNKNWTRPSVGTLRPSVRPSRWTTSSTGRLTVAPWSIVRRHHAPCCTTGGLLWRHDPSPTVQFHLCRWNLAAGRPCGAEEAALLVL